MTTATHLIALLQSHFEGDDEQFYTIAMQAAANEARRGHGKLAQQLRELVDEARARKKAPARGKAVPLVQLKGDLANLVAVRYGHLEQLAFWVAAGRLRWRRLTGGGDFEPVGS